MITQLVKFKPGDDLYWAGTMTLTGVTNFTGYSIASEIRYPDGSLAATATAVFLNVLTGTFSLAVDKLVTVTWPVGLMLKIDVKIIDPLGEVLTTDTAEFLTTARVTT